MKGISQRALAAELVFQPKLDLDSGELAGAEALARWHHPRLGTIAPGQFIAAAEAHGIIERFTDWLLRTAFRQWCAWRDQGLITCLALNLSALSLRDLDFPDRLDFLCRSEGVPSDHVLLEITESATQKAERLLDTLTRFRIKGFGLSLDDFGTGYSSLLQLRQLPYSELKIDRCFVRDAAGARESRLIV